MRVSEPGSTPTQVWGALIALIDLMSTFPVTSHQVLDMEELTIWEQHTATISKVRPPSLCVGADGNGGLVPAGQPSSQ